MYVLTYCGQGVDAGWSAGRDASSVIHAPEGFVEALPFVAALNTGIYHVSRVAAHELLAFATICVPEDVFGPTSIYK